MNRLKPEDAQQLADLLCTKLALDLDAGDTTNIITIGNLLLDLPVENVLPAMKTKVSINRIAPFNLDITPPFDKLLDDCLVYAKESGHFNSH